MAGATSDDIGVRERVVAGAVAATVAAVIVNPFDIVKTRMQANALASVSTSPNLQLCSCYHRTLYERWGICDSLPSLTVRRTPKQWAAACFTPSSSAAASASSNSNSMWRTFRSIVRQEGPAVMWRGTSTSLLVSAPMVGIYMPLYDVLRKDLEHTGATVAPVLAGAIARTLAVFAVAPFELARTRLQASNTGGAVDALRSLVAADAPDAAASARGGLAGHVRHVPKLWTGFAATWVRDVPFSALYWAMVEPLRTALLQPQLLGAPAAALSGGGSSGSAAQHAHHSAERVLVANLISGALAGAAAAAITTPFDVVKTRHQLQPAAAAAASAALLAPAAFGHHPSCAVALAAAGGAGEGLAAQPPEAAPPPMAPAAAGAAGRRSVLGTLGEVYKQEGLPGLFTGVKPRALRAAPACAIVISCYELLKNALTE